MHEAFPLKRAALQAGHWGALIESTAIFVVGISANFDIGADISSNNKIGSSISATSDICLPWIALLANAGVRKGSGDCPNGRVATLCMKNTLNAKFAMVKWMHHGGKNQRNLRANRKLCATTW